MFHKHITLKATAGLVVLGACFWYYHSEDNVTRIIRAFEVGKLGYEKIPNKFKVDRPDVVAKIKTLFEPTKTPYSYFLIVGETGTGKSTAIREAVSELEVPRGVVYFMSPESPRYFTLGLAKILNYDPYALDLFGTLKRRITGRSEAVPQTDFQVLRDDLTKAAEKYKAKHGRQPVLIIDAADFIAKRDPALMLEIQDFAKTEADASRLRIVFASNEDSTLPLMTASSSIERARIVEIGDITDEQAINYLKVFNVPEDRAIDAVANIIGGRLIDLVQYASSYSMFTKFKSNADYRKPFDIGIRSTLVDLNLRKDHSLFDALKSGPVAVDTAKTKVSAEQLVLAQHADQTLSFHSRVVETFFRN
jgi:hypothetical protein